MLRVLVVLVAVLACVQQALAYKGCLDKDCSKIENTVNGVCNSYKSAGVGYCNCASGYYWSGKDVKCLKVPANTVYIKDGVVDAASSRLVTAWFIVGAQYKDKQYWTPARDFCKTQVSSDSDLASPLLEADNNNLAKELTKALGAGSDAAWIGLTTEKFSNTKSDWFFLATRKTPAYSAWDTGYPFMLAPPVGSTGLPQACGMLYAAGDAGRWQNGVCAGYVRAFVCQLMY